MGIVDRALSLPSGATVRQGINAAGRGIDRAVGVFSPSAAVQRTQQRQVLARYEGAQPSRNRRTFYPSTSGDAEIRRDAVTLRNMARDLDRNHDIARGALDILVRNVIGANGIGIEPMPKEYDGDINTDLSDQIQHLWTDWTRRPEVRWERSWASCQRIVARSWLRDGEGLSQSLIGNIPTLRHGTKVPFSLELLECDVLPMHYDDPSRGIIQSIERNTWGQRLAFHIHKGHPGDLYAFSGSLWPDMKRVSADRMLMPFMSDRISQGRGVSLFASAITRLFDIKDYEESERVAAKVAASMAAYIRKGTPDMYEPQVDANGKPTQGDRNMRFSPGMIFDSLNEGEEIGTIDSKRPNPEVQSFRQGQLKAASRGLGVGGSSMSGTYDGSYSAQRQELVEQWASYAVLADEFVHQFIRPVYEQFVSAAIASGQLTVPRDVDPLHIAHAGFRPPPMPWIDPVKEAQGLKILNEIEATSMPDIIRSRGGDYRDVLRKRRDYQDLRKQHGLAANDNTGDSNASQS